MLVLDENLPISQRELLRRWRIRHRTVGVEVAYLGIEDQALVPVLRRLSQPTFFSLDARFFQREWAHPNYCLVWLDVADDLAAEFIRRFLTLSDFDTQAKRMGVVARVHPSAVHFWRFPELKLRASLLGMTKWSVAE